MTSTVTTPADILSAEAVRALDEFMSLKDVEYIEAWKSLPPPSFNEMDGEFTPLVPPNFNEVHKKFWANGLFNEENPAGYWLGKAFKPLGQVTGEGYNIWRMLDGRVERRIRYGTHLGSSRVDGRPSLLMTYASFNRDVPGFGGTYAWQGDMVDEMRKLADGVYVGLGTSRLSELVKSASPLLDVYLSYGLQLKDSYELHERTPATCAFFVLTGPVSDCIGVDDPTAEDQ
jgi:hypothetical protein